MCSGRHGFEQQAILHPFRLVNRRLEGKGGDDIPAHIAPVLTTILTFDIVIVLLAVALDAYTEQGENILLVAVELTNGEERLAILIDARVRPTAIDIILTQMTGGNGIHQPDINLEDLCGAHDTIDDLTIDYLLTIYDLAASANA